MKNFIRTILLFAFVVFSASAVYPCSCDFWNPRKKLRKAEDVFVGEAIEVGHNDKSKDFPNTVKFKVERHWKGAEELNITVVTTDNYCFTITASKGEKYSIYA